MGVSFISIERFHKPFTREYIFPRKVLLPGVFKCENTTLQTVLRGVLISWESTYLPVNKYWGSSYFPVNNIYVYYRKQNRDMPTTKCKIEFSRVLQSSCTAES